MHQQKHNVMLFELIFDFKHWKQTFMKAIFHYFVECLLDRINCYFNGWIEIALLNAQIELMTLQLVDGQFITNIL